MLVTAFIYKSTYSDTLLPYPSEITGTTYLLVGRAEFEFEIPADFNQTAAEISNLERTIEQMRDDCHKSIGQLQRRIADLQCIENTVTT